MSEQPLLPDLDKRWSVSQTLEAIMRKEGQTFLRGDFTYFVQRVDESIVELHTHRVIRRFADTGAGVRGFVLVAYTPEMGDGPVIALPFVIIPPGDGHVSHPEYDKGIPVVVETGFSDIEGSLDVLETLLMDDDYVADVDPLDYELSKTTHGPALGWSW